MVVNNIIIAVSKVMDYLPDVLYTSMELNIFYQGLVKIFQGR